MTVLPGLLPPGEFIERYQQDCQLPGIRLVKIEANGRLIGFGYGLLLQADSDWWSSLTSSAMPDSFTWEDGQRTFAVRAIVVRPHYRRLGHGQVIHDALLRDNPVERSTLMVPPEVPAALGLCENLGYLFVGAARPQESESTYLSMVRETSGGSHRKIGRR
ncbi:GNAT family N-acetyltransferase [Streptomyces sp. NPDC051576]|uniref:GNAT family N-acetyltransferase n=1 Tax=Streptomyces sp. NPDC051576 TaxID=3155803 RepID=UPI0034177EE9